MQFDILPSRKRRRDSHAQIYNSLEPTKENPNLLEEAEARFKLSPDYQAYVAKPLQDAPAGSNGTSGASGASGTSGQPVVKESKKPGRGNPLKQFLLLSTRHMELLSNNMGN